MDSTVQLFEFMGVNRMFIRPMGIKSQHRNINFIGCSNNDVAHTFRNYLLQ